MVLFNQNKEKLQSVASVVFALFTQQQNSLQAACSLYTGGNKLDSTCSIISTLLLMKLFEMIDFIAHKRMFFNPIQSEGLLVYNSIIQNSLCNPPTQMSVT